MVFDDDTFSDSDNGSSGDTYIYTGSSHCHGHSRSNAGNVASLVLILSVAAVIIAININGDKSYGSRHEAQTKAMIEVWALQVGVAAVGHSCKHESSRALCDVRLSTGETKHVQCGKGGCVER